MVTWESESTPVQKSVQELNNSSGAEITVEAAEWRKTADLYTEGWADVINAQSDLRGQQNLSPLQPSSSITRLIGPRLSAAITQQWMIISSPCSLSHNACYLWV